MVKKKLKQASDKISKIVKPCTACYSPQFLKFNFTFMSPKCIPDQDMLKAEVLERIIYVSNFTLMQLKNMDKYKGFELIPKKEIKEFAKKPTEKDSDHKFVDGHRLLSDKCYILRLNNDTMTRFIGEVIKNIFYVYCIDFTGKAYDH